MTSNRSQPAEHLTEGGRSMHLEPRVGNGAKIVLVHPAALSLAKMPRAPSDGVLVTPCLHEARIGRRESAAVNAVSCRRDLRCSRSP